MKAWVVRNVHVPKGPATQVGVLTIDNAMALTAAMKKPLQEVNIEE